MEAMQWHSTDLDTHLCAAHDTCEAPSCVHAQNMEDVNFLIWGGWAHAIACQPFVYSVVLPFWGSWVLQAGSCRELGASIYELDHVANLAQDGSSGWLLPAIHTFSPTHHPWGTVLVLL